MVSQSGNPRRSPRTLRLWDPLDSGTLRVIRFPVSPASAPALGIAGGIALLSWWGWLKSGHPVFAFAGGGGGIVAAALLWFYRDPERAVPVDARVVLSPADGTVRRVLLRRRMIEIFMSPLNVHVNRAPVAGTVASRRFTKGAYLAAYEDASGTRNTRCATVFRSPRGRVKITQVAGALARKVECWVKPGQRVRQGQRIGIIHLGSQVRVELPRSASILARPGERVRAGLSRLAKW